MQNVLVTAEETTRLMDFGLSRKVVDASNRSKTAGIGLIFFCSFSMC